MEESQKIDGIGTAFDVQDWMRPDLPLLSISRKEILLLRSSGDMVLMKTLARVEPCCMCVMPDGGFAVGGVTHFFEGGPTNGVVIYDPNNTEVERLGTTFFKHSIQQGSCMVKWLRFRSPTKHGPTAHWV